MRQTHLPTAKPFDNEKHCCLKFLAAWVEPARIYRKRGFLRLAVVILFGAFGVGCVPMRYTSGPGAKGRVVDANTHAPVANAFVTLTRSEGTAAQTTTARNGDFHIGSHHRWYMLNLFKPSKVILQPAVLTIEGGSYLSFATNSAPGAKMLELGEIQLKPLNP